MEPLTVHHLVALLLDLMDYVKKNTQRQMSGLLVGHHVKCHLNVFLLLFVCFLVCLAPSLSKSAVSLAGHLLYHRNRCRSQQDMGRMESIYSWFEREMTLDTSCISFTVAEICNITIHSSMLQCFKP